MKVFGLNGKQYSFIPKQNAYSTASNKSSLHLAARAILNEAFPFDVIFEEVPLAGTDTPQHGVLYADFVIVRRKLVIEAHGQQHYKFTPFYHIDMNGWIMHKTRDKNKRLWCEINGWTYVELKHDEQHNWSNQLKQL